MPNILNERMCTEIEGILDKASDCVVVDFTGMSVEDSQDLRNSLRESEIGMRVVKTSLARLAAKDRGFSDFETVFDGPSALVFGGDSVATVARKIRDFSRGRKTPKVRGGFLEKKMLDAEQVSVLANLPPRDELLAQVIGTIIAPLTHSVGAANALLAAVPGLTKSLEEKNQGGEGSD